MIVLKSPGVRWFRCGRRGDEHVPTPWPQVRDLARNFAPVEWPDYWRR